MAKKKKTKTKNAPRLDDDDEKEAREIYAGGEDDMMLKPPDHVRDNDDFGDGDASGLLYESEDDDDIALKNSKKEKRKREERESQKLDYEEKYRKTETAEEKRRRLARLYLDKLRREAALEGDDESDLEENEDVDPSIRKKQRDLDSHDRLADKLARDAAEAAGRYFREIADEVKPTKKPVLGTYFSRKAHKQSVTGVCLSSDDRTAYSVSKDGAIVEWDVETGKRTKYPRCPVITEEEMRTKGGGGPMAPPRSGAGVLLTVACSSEKNIVAVGGNDKRIHIFDTRMKKFVTTFAGHRGAVTGLTFRHGTGQLFSCSEDRTVKIWSVDDMAYVDTLFGHQSELNGIDAHRRERCATVSSDRTLRAWKIAEDSQLVFRPSMNDDKRKDYAMECVASVAHDHWITGARDGAVSLWSASKKKPLSTFSNVHGYDEPIGVPKNWEEEDGEIVLADRMATQEALNLSVEDKNHGGCGYFASSVVSAAVGKGTNLCATGAGDGTIRLWKATPGEKDTALEPKHSLPQRGFVNGLAIASSGKFLLAGVGQEPRLGRWGRDAGAKNGVVMHRLDHVVDEDDSDEDDEESDDSMDEEEDE